MKEYLDLAQKILDHGVRKPNRTGVDTLSLFGEHVKLNLAEGFPLLTTKKVSWKAIVIELLWFLSGKTNVDFLHRHNVHVWDLWTDDKGDVDAHYGVGWRAYPAIDYNKNIIEVDQIQNVIDTLKNDPFSRRMVVTPWNPAKGPKAKLPPCHSFWTVNVQLDESGEKTLNLHLTSRSSDLGCGIVFNWPTYALMAHLLSRFSEIKVGLMSHVMTDVHIYISKENGDKSEFDHRPGFYEQLKRQPMILPKLVLDESIQSLQDIENLIDNATTEEIMSKFILKGYDPYGAIKLRPAP